MQADKRLNDRPEAGNENPAGTIENMVRKKMNVHYKKAGFPDIAA
jgi:hypothetical protein